MNVLSVRRRLQRDRRAFTLVELLIVIVLISILASMTVFTLHGVQEDAKETRTRAIITKINEMIAPKWESYRTRPLPIRVPATMDPRAAALMRLNAVRALMRMELPDRKADLCVYDGSNWIPPDSIANPAALYSTTPMWPIAGPPTAWMAYHRRIAANNVTAGGLNAWTVEHEQAECLYMILAATRDGNSTALEWFSEKEIGDTDNDGMLEILDAWGRPIYYLRWAPGFVSDLNGNPTNRTPDPFDPLRADLRWTDADVTNDPFAIFPLIYSGGRDRLFGLVTPPSAFLYQTTAPLLNDPYTILTPFPGLRLSIDADDDITNHLPEVR